MRSSWCAILAQSFGLATLLRVGELSNDGDDSLAVQKLNICEHKPTGLQARAGGRDGQSVCDDVISCSQLLISGRV